MNEIIAPVTTDLITRMGHLDHAWSSEQFLDTERTTFEGDNDVDEDTLVGIAEDIAYDLHTNALYAFATGGLTIDAAVSWTASVNIRIGLGYAVDVGPAGEFHYDGPGAWTPDN